jgi:valyl-tRNA synthetase
MIEIPAVYQPKDYEQTIWDFWQQHKIFEAKNSAPDQAPYTILMPPPNVTSQLHMGHGLGYSIQDLLIRWQRMQGKNALWLPGTDHAGIATQMMVEQALAKEGTSRKALGRHAFFERCVTWKDAYGDIILSQFAKLGFSCDWSRLAYTMDPDLSAAVRHVFVTLYEEGLVYRGERLVNWDPVLQTALSDDEVELKELGGSIWQYRYPVVGAQNTFIPVATTRPETLLGDTAIAVHPDDPRYAKYVGKQVRVPCTDRQIPIIADTYVDPEFGTGAVKITPAHDPNDFAIGQRHSLPMLNIFHPDASLNEEAPPRLRGLDRFAARKQILKELVEADLFDEEKPHKYAVPHSERSGAIIEPRLSLQWYVKMSALAEAAADAARSGEVRFHPESWQKTYLYWLDNIQDWCISRQLWWDTVCRFGIARTARP